MKTPPNYYYRLLIKLKENAKKNNHHIFHDTEIDSNGLFLFKDIEFTMKYTKVLEMNAHQSIIR